MTHRTNLTIIIEIVDLDINCIYSHNNMVGMDKISCNVLDGSCACVEKTGVGWGV
jgi:hypothetical protein